MNNITLVGRLGKDAETKQLKEKTVTNFTLAVSTNGETQWINCRYWNAGKVTEFLRKGKLIGLTGELLIEHYEKDGATLVSPVVNVRRVELLGKKDNENE